MRRVGSFVRCLALAGVAAAAAGGCCTPFRYSVAAPNQQQLARSACLPQAARNHVHIFFIHGMDPCDWANLSGVCDFLHSLGYTKTHYGQLYHVWTFEDDVRRIHKEDPSAHFVLIGFSFGANMVRNVAQVANAEHIPIDLLVYLGGNTLENCSEDKPENALHIVNILATGCIWNGDYLEGADNLSYGDVWHFGSPSHPKTLEVLVEELANVAARVPVVVREAPEWHWGEEAPTPRPVSPPKVGKRDEWDFLKPADWGTPAPAPREMKKADD